MKSFCVIGLGAFGTAVAETLAADGKQVLVIDKDADKVTGIADVVTHAVIGDATSAQILRSAGVQDYECVVVALADNINDNVLLTIMLKDMGIPKVVARAQNEGHSHVLKRIGADMVIFSEKDMGERVAYKLARDNVSEYMELRGFQIVETRVPSDWTGKNLVELDIRRRFGVTIVAISNADGVMDVSPMPTRVFAEGDSMTVLGDGKAIEKLMKQY